MSQGHNFDIHTVSTEFGGKTLTIETGKLAKQANGSVMVSYGDTRVLVSACGAKEARPDASFFPLTVEYQEKFYSSGKIPGGFLRREGRPSNDATLAARLIDRPIRPLFPEGYRCEVQVAAIVMSLDKDADPEVAASIGASAALHISDIPFNGPTAGCRVGRINGEFVCNPTWDQIQEGESDIDILVSGTDKAIMMVEGSAQEVPEPEILNAVLFGHDEIRKITRIIEELREKAGKPKREFEAPQLPADIVSAVESAASAGVTQALQTVDKLERYTLLDEIKTKVKADLVPESEVEADKDAAKAKLSDVSAAFDELKYKSMRSMILKEGKRIDGRDTKQIRPISVEAGVLPGPHGSSLFTRGETQVLATVTLGTGDDEQMIDSMYENSYRKFMLHYNFPPFSVGECGRMGGTSRREIGHGFLAERSIQATLPKHEEFPYTVRIVCETLESNGSSSMGSVCSASMALMDAGVPYPKPVAGIAMGLIKEESDVAILSDILGDEDHLGDMDFKVAGTAEGVTGIQMDIKIEGVDKAIMETALQQAHEGRLHILGEMKNAIDSPRDEMADNAPRITTMTIPVDKIGKVVGPGGKQIKAIVSETGVKVDINDDGIVNIASTDGVAAKKAQEMIEGLVAEVQLDKVYKGTVKKIVDFGAFVGVLPNQEGLLHISEIAHERVNNVEDYMKEGDEVEVKVIEIDDRSGKIRLSRRVLLPEPEGGAAPRSSGGGNGDRGDRGGRGRGDRGRGGRGGGRPGGGRGGNRDERRAPN